MLPENLKSARKRSNLTQDDVAAHLNVKRQTYSAYERGASIPDALTLLKISNFFNVSADELLRGEGEKDRLTNEQAAAFMRQVLKETDLTDAGGELTPQGAEIITDFIVANKEMLKRLIKKEE